MKKSILTLTMILSASMGMIASASSHTAIHYKSSGKARNLKTEQVKIKTKQQLVVKEDPIAWNAFLLDCGFVVSIKSDRELSDSALATMQTALNYAFCGT